MSPFLSSSSIKMACEFKHLLVVMVSILFTRNQKFVMLKEVNISHVIINFIIIHISINDNLRFSQP